MTIKRIAGPAFLAAAAADIYTPPAATIVTYIYHIHIANVDTAVFKATLYVGGTGGSTAGTELCKAHEIDGGDEFDLHFPSGLKMSSTDFLTGLADSASKLVITVMGEQMVVT